MVCHQLGDINLLIHTAADLNIAIPLILAGVIGRRRGQRNYFDFSVQQADQLFQRLLPDIFQMMRFIEANCFDARLPDQLRQVDF